MSYTAELIRQQLAELAPETLEIVDDSAGVAAGGHFRLIIVSNRFAGLNTLARRRLVHQALGGLMNGRIHALSINALTPGEL